MYVYYNTVEVLYRTVRYGTVLNVYGTIRYGTVLYCTVQYCTVTLLLRITVFTVNGYGGVNY
jgi:hypothetical protein